MGQPTRLRVNRLNAMTKGHNPRNSFWGSTAIDVERKAIWLINEQPNEMESPIEDETPQDEQESPEDAVEDLEDVENELFDISEEDSEIEDYDEPVAFYGAMRHKEESSMDENVIQCAMMHEDNLLDLEELSMSQPIRQKWEWSCQYGAMHQEKECNHRIQHVGLDLWRGNPLLEKAIGFPEHFAEKEFERGVDYGTRTRQEPISSADERLHVACHLMAHHLRVIEKERKDLLIKTVVVHSAVYRASHNDDEIEERVKSLIQDLRDHRKQHAALWIDQHEVVLDTRLGTVWVNREGQIESHPKLEHPRKYWELHESCICEDH
ncbi:hypothetical protein EV363DRAFT_1170514 [Boletus edulis]|nr:hypothetical protein EV363DRAFT_1170514 [Boletus edulis]